jgi:hypothetical protein
MKYNISKRDSALIIPPIAKKNHRKIKRERDCPNRAPISARRLLTMGEL